MGRLDFMRDDRVVVAREALVKAAGQYGVGGPSAECELERAVLGFNFVVGLVRTPVLMDENGHAFTPEERVAGHSWALERAALPYSETDIIRKRRAEVIRIVTERGDDLRLIGVCALYATGKTVARFPSRVTRKAA